jgi:glycosyltransferase involved in cell wall biosynthesis
MKIGIVIRSFPPSNVGGGSFSCRLIAENLVEKGHEAEVLSFDKKPEDQKDFEYVQRYPINSSRIDVSNVRARSRINRFSEDKDIIHCYGPKYMPSVASINNTKTVSTLNSYHHFYPYSVPGIKETPASKVYRTIHDAACRKILKKTDCFTALSTAVKEQYSRILPEEKIEVIPNMYDPDFPEFNNLETDEDELLYVGSLLKKKGVSDLIEVMQEIEGKRLRIIGDGEEKTELEQKAEELGVENRVIFEGYVDHEQLPEYYERAGWFIHPGRWPEPFGRTILEAMQMKTPVIATNTGGPKEVLLQKQLIEDCSEIPGKLDIMKREELIEDQNNRLDKYSPEKIVKEFEEVYENL